MPKITLYLDDATKALMEQTAKANGLSKNRWVAQIIKKHSAHEWPSECAALAGAFADFALREPSCHDPALTTPDVPRIGF
jgi:hypothetical protein